jgi:hypothetical protein
MPRCGNLLYCTEPGSTVKKGNFEMLNLCSFPVIFYSTVRTCRPQSSKSISPSEPPGPVSSNRSDRSSRLPSGGSPSSSQRIPSFRFEFFLFIFCFHYIILIRYLLDRDQLDAGTVMTLPLNAVGLVNTYFNSTFFFFVGARA